MPDVIPENKEEVHHSIQTYQSDLEHAMDTTDAKVVQQLLETAREREIIEKERLITKKEKAWYRAGGIVLIMLALAAIGYGIYYYSNLTVPVQKTASVGVFQNTKIFITKDLEFSAAIKEITSLENLNSGKPYLVPLVTDQETLAPISIENFFPYIDARASEPFIASLSLARFGVFDTGDKIIPFLIFSVPDPEIASKEFLIAEPNILSMFAPALNIDLDLHQKEIGKSFTSSYMYNLPVRILKSQDPDTKNETILLYYGYATDHTIVLTTNPTILKAIYDTIIKQH